MTSLLKTKTKEALFFFLLFVFFQNWPFGKPDKTTVISQITLAARSKESQEPNLILYSVLYVLKKKKV